MYEMTMRTHFQKDDFEGFKRPGDKIENFFLVRGQSLARCKLVAA